ncbi:MAG: c-type cytochrome [Chitinophagaceae bacterium]|nr:MAG: c-type cytochrome [Chitinophagaceae bacterium]
MNLRIELLLLTFIIFALVACKDKPVNASLSFEEYRIADGFRIELAASDPFIQAPVGLDFDNRGRMWVVEMRGFMPNLAGTGDDQPTGRISILEDTDDDGYADCYKVFLDGLVLPRSLSHVYNGLLYTAPPYLWFVEINGDKPGKTTLVDSTYGEGGSPEAQANGLMMNVDNWIYSANSQFRYQLREGNWIREPTTFRGQFGISKDDFGRLYYNYNTIQLAGDYVLPNTLIGNKYYKPAEGINKVLTKNQRVYPLHATTVNRGYVEGVLDKDSVLLNFTAACGTLIYRGGQFPEEYNQNAFACEPQANLVKRNILLFRDDTTIATQAWDDREFLASTDEGFRPVNLFNGPDGAMYVVDMHRGVMEYRAFTTPYYNAGIAAKQLDTLLSAGRILRIVSTGKPRNKIPDLSTLSSRQLVELLKSENGWLRDRAQQVLILAKDLSIVPALTKLSEDGGKPSTAIHALHVLEGLHTLDIEMLRKSAMAGNPMLTAHSLLLLQKFATNENVRMMASLTNDLLRLNNPVINLYLATSLDKWNELAPQTFLPVLSTMSQLYPARPIYQEAIVSSLGGMEERFRDNLFKTSVRNEIGVIDTILKLAIRNRKEGKMNPIYAEARMPVDSRTNGLTLYRNNCASCHGADGNGIELVAPPLNGSEYVSGSTNRLAMIILNGLEGPIHINGQLYKFNNTMPTFASNLTNDQIADIIKFVHNAYVTTPVKPITTEEIEKLRSRKKGTLTGKDLLELANEK